MAALQFGVVNDLTLCPQRSHSHALQITAPALDSTKILRWHVLPAGIGMLSLLEQRFQALCR